MASTKQALELWKRGARVEAQRALEGVLRVSPDDPEALRYLADAYAEGGRPAEALALASRLTGVRPTDGRAWRRRAELHLAARQLPQAVDALIKAVALEPGNPRGHHNLGLAYLRLGQHTEAIASLQRAVELDASYVLAHTNLGLAYRAAGEMGRARHCFERALSLDATMTNARVYLSELLTAEDPVAAHMEENRALESLAINLMTARRYPDAAAAWRQLLQRDASYPFARGLLFHCRIQECDWRDYADECAALLAALDRGEAVDTPFNVFVYSANAARQLQAAQVFTRVRHPAVAAPPPAPMPGARIRLAYLSSEFHAHATSFLLAEVLERHDRNQFEVRVLSYGPDDGSPMRQRIRNAVESFIDIRGASDAAVAEALRGWGAHIAVDLKGHTGGARTGIFARRPAPLQINFLGYPGTLGASYYDYIVADRHVIPPNLEPYYEERCLILPRCYQPNDRMRPRPADAADRSEYGLPATGFVFGCFNQLYKITPFVFDTWCGLLRDTPGSVLWLLDTNAAAVRNLRAVVARAGVDPTRLIAAPERSLEAHLARYHHMDLFLDTFPCNAHTTASDALWMGVPLVTMVGDGFASRVAASLLHSMGVAELVTSSLAEYAELARRLAGAPARCAQLRQRLDSSRAAAQLFDATAYTRNLESAYLEAWQTTRCAGPAMGSAAQRAARQLD